MQPPTPAKPAWVLSLPAGTVVVRTERPDDAGFLAILFRSHATPLPDIDPKVAEALLDMQWRSRSRSYRTAYPQAWSAVLEMAGQPFGRLLLDCAPTCHIVDYALLPAARGRGLGGAILAELLHRVAGPVTNTVLCTNLASLAMCRRAGFVVTAERQPFVEMTWWPPSPHAPPAATTA